MTTLAAPVPHVGSTSPGASTGSTIGSSSSPHDAKRRRRLSDRTALRPLLASVAKSVACCGLGLAHGTDQPYAEARRGKDGAHLSGVSSCSSPWSCPVCAPTLAAARAEALCPQVDTLTQAGWTSWLLTFTLRHQRADDLRSLLGGLSSAWKAMTSGKAWDSFRRVGAPEYVRGLDITYGQGSGWHPHIHALVMLPPSRNAEQAEAAARWMSARWLTCLQRFGFEGMPDAQDVRRADSPSDAVSYAVRPAAVYEASAMVMKRSQGKGKGLTPFELVDRWRAGDKAAGALFRDYAAGTKGVRQCTTSRGLRLKDDDLAAQAASEKDAEAPEVVAVIWKQGLARLDGDRRADFLEAAGASAAAGLAVLARLLGPPVVGLWLPGPGILAGTHQESSIPGSIPDAIPA